MTKAPVKRYFEGHLLRFKGEPLLRRLEGVSCAVGFRIKGLEGSAEYLLKLSGGAIEAVEEGWGAPPEIVYTTSEETFFRIVGGSLRAETAFLKRQVSIGGHLLRGLKLAFLLQEFFDHFPYRPVEGETWHESVREKVEDPILFPEGMVEERIEIPGSTLTVRAVYPEEGPIRGRVILAPPHPYLGGSSDNAVILKLSSELALRGMFVARFDYSDPTSQAREMEEGVRSFWESSDAGYRMGAVDLEVVHDWVQYQTLEGDPGVTWIGYSYGAQVCLWAGEWRTPARRIFISPVATQLGEETMNCDCPTLLIGATEDFATSQAEFRALAGAFPRAPMLREVEGADHFFTGRARDLVEEVLKYLQLDREISPPVGAGVGS